MDIDSYRRIRLLRSDESEFEVEFITIMEFDSINSIRQFVGPNYPKSYVPEEAQRILSHNDEHAKHYPVKEDRIY